MSEHDDLLRLIGLQNEGLAYLNECSAKAATATMKIINAVTKTTAMIEDLNQRVGKIEACWQRYENGQR